MNLTPITTYNFYSNLFENNNIPEKCGGLLYNGTKIGSVSLTESKEKISALSLFPDYLQLDVEKNHQLQCVHQKFGYAINLEGFKSIDDFINSTKTNFKKVILRSVRRLESSFNMSYKMFYGNIEKENYTNLMALLQSMIENRFEQRNGRNKVLANWDYYLQLAYHNILNKTASLFVMYNNDKPIEISLNFHVGNIMYSAISSYDLNYSKFSLGNIEIYKQLEWCIENNIVFFDMGYGEFEHKIRWSNYQYEFKTCLVSPKNNLISAIAAFYYKYIYASINYLLKHNLNDKFYDFIDVFSKSNKKNNLSAYQIVKSEEKPNNLKPIDIDDANNAFLKKPFFDFLYSYQEHINDVKIYKNVADPKSYYIIGKKKNNLLSFK
jgi:hypothetical protein